MLCSTAYPAFSSLRDAAKLLKWESLKILVQLFPKQINSQFFVYWQAFIQDQSTYSQLISDILWSDLDLG